MKQVAGFEGVLVLDVSSTAKAKARGV